MRLIIHVVLAAASVGLAAGARDSHLAPIVVDLLAGLAIGMVITALGHAFSRVRAEDMPTPGCFR